jgi:hypothetical protein
MIVVSPITGGFFGEKKPVGKPRGRWEDAVRRADVGLLQTRKGKAGARMKESWMNDIGEAMVRKWAKAPCKKMNKN